MNSPSTRLTRLNIFFTERFPIVTNAGAGLITFLAIYGGLQVMSGSAVSFTTTAWVGMISSILFLLLLRVYDELKDVETDLRLGALGDPNFKDRPIVTGEIKVEDLHFLRWVVTGTLFVLHIPYWGKLPFYSFLVLFVLCWLSFKWFFVPSIKSNIVWALVTHNPLVLVQALYITSLYIYDYGTGHLQLQHAALIIGLWLPLTIWETSRKIRLPEDETEYQTYSSVLGWRTATKLPLILIVVSTLCVFFVLHAINTSLLLVMGFMLAAAFVGSRYLSLLIKPASYKANLRPVAEVYVGASNIAIITALVLQYFTVNVLN